MSMVSTRKRGQGEIVVAQIGARRHYIVPRALAQHGLLRRFYTDICVKNGVLRILDELLPEPLRGGPVARLLDRKPGLSPSKIRCFPFYACSKIFETAGESDHAELAQKWARRNRWFGRLVVRASEGTDADAFYVFNGAGLEILDYCRDEGLRGIMDQTIAPLSYERRLLAEERDRWPDWFFDREAGRRGLDALERREREEWKRADTIICGSDFVKEAVRCEGGPGGKCAVVPYGINRDIIRHERCPSPDRSLHVLFAGTVQPRKGIQYFYRAAEALEQGPFEFRAVGPLEIPGVAVKKLSAEVDVKNPVPRSAMGEEYEWADVLVHPSLCEGSANVCYEALANGVPVVTTPNSGSVVRDGRDGFIVPIRDHEEIVEALRRFVRSPRTLEEMSRSALSRARQFTWDDYARRLVKETCAIQREK